MNSLKPLQWAGLLLAAVLGIYAVYSHLGFFGNVAFLGNILLLEIIIASLWKYEQRFFFLLITAFLFAGMRVPTHEAWTAGRWVVLVAGAGVGYVLWMTNPRGHVGSVHLLAVFCVAAAFVSATVSPYLQMAWFKAFSLFLLFLYCAFGARVAILGREERFFHGLLWASEVVVYATAICYFGLGQPIWGNPNSLGAAMSIGVFPILLWGWLTADAPLRRFRRLMALLLCAWLIMFSMARAGMISMALVTLVFCFGLHQYKLLAKVTGLVLVVVAITGMLAPAKLSQTAGDISDAVLYKGHKEEGVLGSRRTPWEESIASIKQHPWFGTGYGTSPTGGDPGLDFGRFASSAETNREHGSSYMAIAEWVGLLGVVPFVGLLALTLRNVCRVCLWMRRTANPRHYSIPLAMVIMAGFIHANFEDWLFAVGAYPCVYFWVFAFVLADLVPLSEEVPAAVLARAPASSARFGVAVANR